MYKEKNNIISQSFYPNIQGECYSKTHSDFRLYHGLYYYAFGGSDPSETQLKDVNSLEFDDSEYIDPLDSSDSLEAALPDAFCDPTTNPFDLIADKGVSAFNEAKKAIEASSGSPSESSDN